MSGFTRGLGLGLLGLCCLGLMGCSESNESIVDKQARETASAKVPDLPPPPKTQAEFGERSKASSSQNKANRYPGARQ